MVLLRWPTSPCTTGRSSGAPSAPAPISHASAASTPMRGSGCISSIRARWCRNRTCRPIDGCNRRRSTATSPRLQRRSKARPSWTPWSPICKGWGFPDEPIVGTRRRHRHAGLDAGLHRDLGLGLASAPQERVRCACEAADARRGGRTMTEFLSTWVIVLAVVNLGITVFLFLWGLRVDIPTQPDGTSGHVWAHGVLREGVRRLPTWWVVLSAASLIAGLGYLALYPGLGAFAGALGWTSADELARQQDANRRLEAPLLERVRGKPVETIAADPEALRVGQVLFIENCAACHG